MTVKTTLEINFLVSFVVSTIRKKKNNWSVNLSLTQVRSLLCCDYEASSQNVLKGPKLEIFGFGVFALIRPVWIGDLGTRPKITKS